MTAAEVNAWLAANPTTTGLFWGRPRAGLSWALLTFRPGCGKGERLGHNPDAVRYGMSTWEFDWPVLDPDQRARLGSERKED